MWATGHHHAVYVSAHGRAAFAVLDLSPPSVTSRASRTARRCSLAARNLVAGLYRSSRSLHLIAKQLLADAAAGDERHPSPEQKPPAIGDCCDTARHTRQLTGSTAPAHNRHSSTSSSVQRHMQGITQFGISDIGLADCASAQIGVQPEASALPQAHGGSASWRRPDAGGTRE